VISYEILDQTDDLRLKPFQQVRDSLLRQKDEVLIDSAKVVCRYLKLGFPLKTLIAPESFICEQKDLLKHWPEAQVLAANRKVLESIVGHKIHSGVTALGARPQDVSLGALGDRIIFLNGVNNSENVGTIARNALAFGATSIIADQHSCSPYVRRSIRVSMGSVFKCKIHHCTNALMALHELKLLGYHIFAASFNNRSVDVRSVRVPQKSVLIIGCEGDGLQGEVEDFADQCIHISMQDGIDSLNAAVASGILLHHFSHPDPLAFF
jgi:tRNA G18 (ribose-2'-O)-methylase SpoU